MFHKIFFNTYIYIYTIIYLYINFNIFYRLIWTFQERDILNSLMIPAKVFLAFMTTLEDHYVKDNPFHNSLHAADVAQSTNVLLNTPALENVFTSLEICSALFAACIHDVDHPGLTNQFLINSSKFLKLI